jgi:hypothetical protein
MSKSIFLAMLAVITACSVSKKQSSNLPIYTETSGLNLVFRFTSKAEGYLLVSNQKDTIPFNYKLIKKRTRAIDSENLSERSIPIFEYHINYIGEKYESYEILENFMVLYSFKKVKKLEYASSGVEFGDPRILR